ncbi:MAG TPA: hypothetical protein VN985_07485 [Candidatus Eisenbacteria bacterium]|nr:hypothetical protein [Candidatus Eisenbacteria bacterium]
MTHRLRLAALVFASIVLSVSALIIIYHHAIAAFLSPSGGGCGGGYVRITGDGIG